MNRLLALTNGVSLAVVIFVMGITAGSIFSNVQTVNAQNLSSAGIGNSNTTTSLGDPFFVEKGSIIGQRVLSVSPQPQLEFTVVANATINGNISATNTGTTVGDLQPNGVFRSTGQGFIMTQGGEVATYTSQVVGNVTKDGRVLSVGANFWSTPSTGELAFLNDMMNIFRLESDRSGNFSAMGWEWK